MALRDDKKKETAEEVTGKKNQAVSETNTANDSAENKTRELEKEQQNRSKTDLDPNAGKDIAKGQSQYGMFNNRDYGTTLRLAREADRYNNKPVDKKMTFHAGASGQAGSVSYMDKYERPKIQTMETRAMNQVQQLDTQQKSLAIALQDAVNHKDLNAFIQAYQQMYGITLSKRDAEVAMTQMARTAETQQILAQGMDYFKRAFGTETGTDLYYMAQNGNGQLASAISAIITNGMVPPQQAEIFAQEYMNQKMSEYKQQNPNATMQDAFNYGLGAYNRNIAQFSNYQAANLSHDTGWLARTKAWWSTL